MTANRGIQILPADTLLAERARDFLAAGPADAVTLVRQICQQPGTPIGTAERMAEAMLGGRPEFARTPDGRWRLVGATGSGRVAEQTPEPAAARRAVPSFDEWLARRDAERASRATVERVAEPAAPIEVVEAPRRRRRESSPSVASAGPDHDTPLHALSYVVVDVETTGGSPHTGHRITEIAAVVVRDGEVRDVYETLVNPQRPIPPMIMKLTGITMEMVAGKKPFAAICPDVLGALSGNVFVAHNVNFDWRFVSAEVARASGQRLDGPKLCTVRLARKLLPQLRSRSLGFVADHYGADEFARDYFESRHGRERPWRHSAAGDAVATAHCLLRLFRDASDRGVTTWGELNALLGAGTSRARKRRTAMPSPIDKDTTA
ncbi:MAG TPA: 3'-5' exonuclease [Gemmatimonadaceae bacterium]|nr:3'-5' exonuclease [Gemmatimonadaceae bacterium]